MLAPRYLDNTFNAALNRIEFEDSDAPVNLPIYELMDIREPTLLMAITHFSTHSPKNFSFYGQTILASIEININICWEDGCVICISRDAAGGA